MTTSWDLIGDIKQTNARPKHVIETMTVEVGWNSRFLVRFCVFFSLLLFRFEMLKIGRKIVKWDKHREKKNHKTNVHDFSKTKTL